MACIYKINNVELSEQQFHALVQRAETVINQKRQQMPSEITKKEIFHMISALGITKINAQSLEQINELNDQLGRQFQTEKDFISITPSGQIAINTSLIGEITNEIQTLENPTPERLEQEMNQILFGMANEITGFSCDPKVENKFVGIITYKRSLIKRLQKLLSQVQAAKSSHNPNSEEYATLMRKEKEIEERINGKGHKDQSFYVQGLKREVEELTKPERIIATLAKLEKQLLALNLSQSRLTIGTPEHTATVATIAANIRDTATMNAKLAGTNNIDALFSYLNSDINRLAVLAESQDIHAIYEAKEILQFFNAIHNTSTAGTIGNVNPIFDMAGLKTGDKATIQKFKELSYNVIETFEGKIQLNEKAVLEEMIKKDVDLQKIFGSDQLKYDTFFNSGGVKGLMMKDIGWWDAFMMDGTMGTFSDFGHIPQLSKKILEEGMRKFVSKESQWNERMNTMMPNVTKTLQQMGHGISIMGKTVGASYDMFRQKYENGRKTNRLIDRNSAKFVDELQKMNSDFFSEIEKARKKSKDGTSAATEKEAHRAKNAWNRQNRVMIDPRKLSEITSNPEFAEFSHEFLPETEQHEKELKRHLQSDLGYKQAVAEQVEMVRNYMAEKARYGKDLMEKYGVTSLKDLDPEASVEYGRWQVENDPFVGARHYQNKTDTAVRYRGSAVYPKLIRFNGFIARRFAVEMTTTVGQPARMAETANLTGYYDPQFEQIEKNPVLLEFHNLASEILTECRKHLPLEQQRQMNYNVIASKSKSFMDILADPNLALGRKFSQLLRNIHDKAVGSFTVKVEQANAMKALVDTITGEKQSEVSLQYVKTNGIEIRRNFQLQSTLFVQSLLPIYKENYKTEDGSYGLRKSSKIPFSQLSSQAKNMIGEMMDTSPSESNLKKVLGVKEDGMVYIGRIIEKDVISKLVENETFNLPQALKLYMHGSMEYAGRNQVMPVLSMIKSHYERILKPNQTNSGAAEASVDPNGRKRANEVYDRWYKKHVLGNLTSSVWGVVPSKLFTDLKERNSPDGQVSWQANYSLSSLSYDEKIIHNSLQEAINNELRLPEDKRNMVTVEKLRLAQDQLGKNFALSALTDRFMDLTRAVGLGLSLSGAWYNFMNGKIANYIAATTGQYFSENALWKAESIVLGSHLKMFSGGLVATDNAVKAAILIERFKIFQDSSDEIHKSSMNSAFKIPTIANIYTLQQRTEYVNQAPVLIAMMLDKMISAEGQPDISLWDALDKDGHLIAGYDTIENKATWEKTEDTDSSDFITKVSAAISNIHGDYSTLGGSVYSNEQMFRIPMMFKRWMSRYVHTRLATEYYDHSMGRRMKGRYQSLSAASGTALLTTVGVVLTGFNIPVLIGAVGIGTVWGLTRPSKDADIGYLKELTLNLLQIGTATVLTVPKIVGGLGWKKNVFSKTMVDDFLSNGHRSNELDNGNMKANITEVALTINLLMMRLMFKSMLSDDEDEDNSLVNLAINMCGRTLNEMTLMYNPLAMYDGLTGQPAVIRMVKNLVKLGDVVADALGGDDIYTTGVNTGDSKVGKILQKVIFPSLLRDGLGFGSDMKKINSYYGEFGFDSAFDTDQSKMEDVILNARNKYKAEIANQINESTTQEQVENLALQLKSASPNMSMSLARTKAQKLIEKSIKSEAEKITNDMIPTLGARRKINPEVTLEEVNADIDATLNMQ